MTKSEMAKEIDELSARFKALKKALADDEKLTSLQRAAAEVAKTVSMPKQPLTKEQVLAKARELFEQRQSQQLADRLQKAGILGTRPPPRQPTNEEMQMAAENMNAQANGFSSKEEMEKAESEWGNGLNNWLVEATKPVNARFKNEEEELAYWKAIKVNDNGRGDGGY